jgi:CheY-like chemotaxis protein
MQLTRNSHPVKPLVRSIGPLAEHVAAGIPQNHVADQDNPVTAVSALRIMIVEDEAINAMLLAEVLEDLGHAVCAIEPTEAGAVLAAARCRPDLMIVDAMLGEGSGIAAVATILRSGPVPHLFTSGDVARVAAQRPDAVMLQKPFRIADLTAAIERALATVVCS